ERAKRQGIPPSADGGKGSALDPPAFFTRKGWTEKPVLSLASPYRSFRPTDTDLVRNTYLLGHKNYLLGKRYLHFRINVLQCR
ncbi:MAG: hypothetical protein K6F27_06780, partial [Ruminococcus sp.]|nr:hypothetical protein [Ruminococcus sp.]